MMKRVFSTFRIFIALTACLYLGCASPSVKKAEPVKPEPAKVEPPPKTESAKTESTDKGNAKDLPNEAALDSPFPSTLTERGIDIPNSHLVYQGRGTVLRGQQPKNKIAQLQQAGVNQILIFKNDSAGEVAQELTDLKSAGFTDKQIQQVPFKWRGFLGFEKACQQTLSALRVLVASANRKGSTLYFHCTVGEDRTGYLAGLFKMLMEKKPAALAFREDLCEKGYGAGDPTKPKFVVESINKELTPLFAHFSGMIETGGLTRASLLDRTESDKICQQPVALNIDQSRWTCEKVSIAPKSQ